MYSRLSPLFPYLKRYWRSYVWGTLSLILYNSGKAMIPRLVGNAIEDHEGRAQPRKNSEAGFYTFCSPLFSPRSFSIFRARF